IAEVLRTIPALAPAFGGSLGMALDQPSHYRASGLPGLLVPMIAAGAGSVAFRYGLGPILPWAYVLARAAYYIALSRGGTLFWLISFFLVIIALSAAFWLTVTHLIDI